MKHRISKVAFAIALATSVSVDAKQQKVDICHYGDGGLKILNLPLKAANKHIQRHNDFLPYTLHEDVDLDGFGNPDVFIQSCEEEVYGYTDDDTDLDDTDPWITDGSDDADDDANNPPPPPQTAAPAPPPPTASPMPPPPTSSPMPPPTSPPSGPVPPPGPPAPPS